MLIIENETKYTINTLLLEKIAMSLSKKDVECIFTDAESMQQLNLKERGKNETTDVLSFPLEDLPFAPLGSIVINLEIAFDTAQELNHTLDDECALLFIHGMLHLLGFDHECDNGEMRIKEENIVKNFALPKSLICRNNVF
ncbi:MAG: rRNA maturation RNase YbeY [Campylobacteraceae bacterium]|jgi:probable rRNA maturation factor|nr:rRNA maturation RNase YbeY [Campylobacteraceae bacterium]